MGLTGRAPRAARGRAILLAALLAAPAAGAGAAVQTVTIGDLYDGGTVNLAPGDTLEVRLAPVAGCAWGAAFGDVAILKPQVDPTPAGSVFRYKALTTGSVSLGLACRSASDPQAPAGGLFRVAVVVKDGLMPRGFILEDPDNGSDIFLVQGDTLEVRLPANPSTGYSWSVAANSTAVLRPIGESKFEPPAASRPGAAGTQSFGFRVAAGGGAFLQLVYRRPFEKDAPPARTWGVFVAAASVGP